MARRLQGLWLGRRPYAPIHELQQRLHEQRQRGERGDTVLLLEHEPVITLGRGAKAENILLSEAELEARGAQVAAIGRGGDVTLHAPGQLVCYPIIDLSPERRDVRRYVRDLGEVMRRVVLPFGIDGGFLHEHIGLWVDAARPAEWRGEGLAENPLKIGAIGVRISRWVTLHGFALNLSVDLSQFSWIVPCGIREFGVTSVAALTGSAPDVANAAARAYGILGEQLGAELGPLRDESSTPVAQIELGE